MVCKFSPSMANKLRRRDEYLICSVRCDSKPCVCPPILHAVRLHRGKVTSSSHVAFPRDPVYPFSVVACQDLWPEFSTAPCVGRARSSQVKGGDPSPPCDPLLAMFAEAASTCKDGVQDTCTPPRVAGCLLKGYAGYLGNATLEEEEPSQMVKQEFSGPETFAVGPTREGLAICCIF